MMKRLLLGALAALCFVSPALSQSSVLPYYYNNSGAKQAVGSGFPLPVTGSFSATGFPTVQTTGTPISVTSSAGGVTGSLPNGTVVVATNVGTTNAAYCKLGASATTSDQYIAPSGGWFAFTVGANTQLTCITSTSTTTVNMVGGSGLPTGTGGGSGGGGGSSGAVFGPTAVGSAAANPPVLMGGTADGTATGTVAVSVVKTGNTAAATDKAVVVSDPTLQAIASASVPACAASPCTTVIGDVVLYQGTTPLSATNGLFSNILQGNAVLSATNGTYANQLQGNAVLSATNGLFSNQLQGNAVLSATNPTFTRLTDGTTAQVTDPCQGATKTILPITLATAAVKVIATGVSAKKIYVCAIDLTNNAADSIAVFEATTGTTCATAAVAVVGAGTSVATAATGYNFAANGGISKGQGGFSVWQTTVNNNDLCIAQSAATQLSGTIAYVVQ